MLRSHTGDSCPAAFWCGATLRCLPAPPLLSLQVALECVMLWTKAMFFGMAVDGLGTFI